MRNFELPETVLNSLNYQMPYGIHRGKSLKEIHALDKSYLLFVAKHWRFDAKTVACAVNTINYFNEQLTRGH